MVFHWSLSDSKSPQVSRTLFSILAIINNAVVWMVSTRSPIFKSSRPFNNHLVTVSKIPITIGIIVTFMYHSFFFNSLARSRYLSYFLLSFHFILWLARSAKSTTLQVYFFCWWLYLLTDLMWSVCMSKLHWSLCVSFSRTDAGLCIYLLFEWSNSDFLNISLLITLSSQLCLVLYSFYANLLHSLFMWLIVSYLSTHNLHSLLCCV